MISPSTEAEALRHIISQANYLSRQFCRSKHDAEDLAQDILVKFLINRKHIADDPDDISKWMRRAMVNQQIDKFRKEKPDLSFMPRYIRPDQEPKLHLKQVREFIQHDAKRFPASVKTFLLHLSGYDYMEIASIRKMLVNNVGVRIITERKRVLHLR